jgi:hypothetical protein
MLNKFIYFKKEITILLNKALSLNLSNKKNLNISKFNFTIKE